MTGAPDRANPERPARAPTPSERTPGERTPSERPASGRFDDRFLRKLESLVLAIRRTSSGRMHGGRRSRRVGAGLEPADHRDYAPGDDLRYLDWNLYGRLGRRALRLYEEDEDLSIDVLVDASASMALGAPAKLELALQLGAALAYVGLANLDRVAVTALDADRTGPPASRGKGRILPILRFLDGVEAVGRASLTTAVRAFLSRRSRGHRGLVVLISDFYDQAGARAALELIRRHRLQTIAIQVSAPDELSPSIRGDVRVRDAETGVARDLTVSPGVRAAYTRRHAAWLRELEGHCRERAIPCVALSSSEPFDAVVLRMFRVGGLLR